MVRNNDLKSTPELHLTLKYTPPSKKFNAEAPPTVVYCEQRELILHAPYVALHQVHFDGYLWKRRINATQVHTSWRHRYCAIIDSKLYAFDSPQDKTPSKRIIDLKHIKLEEAYFLEGQKSHVDEMMSKSNCFALREKNQIYYFAVFTKTDYDNWIQVLSTFMNKAQ